MLTFVTVSVLGTTTATWCVHTDVLAPPFLGTTIALLVSSQERLVTLSRCARPPNASGHTDLPVSRHA